MPPRSNTLLAILVALLLGACAAPGIGRPVDFRDLPGWEHDQHAHAWPALQRSCERLSREARWKPLCAAATAAGEPDDYGARLFFETWFVPHRLHGESGHRQGLVTGYFEPLLDGSRKPDERYAWPLYAPPADLVQVELGDLHPELKGRRVRGRLEGRRVVPYFTRASIDADKRPLAGNELLWVDDPVDLFFLHIQGSGRVRLADGKQLGVGYADQNGHPYFAIGRWLVTEEHLQRDEVNLFTIRAWLRNHPAEAGELLARNPSYVFFELRELSAGGPLGALRVPLTPGRSVAVDPAHIPLGIPLWLDTRDPRNGDHLQRTVFAQDTGGAIRGPLRADVFFGHGEEAEQLAGLMKERGRLYALLPREL